EAAGQLAPHDPRWPYLRGLLREAESPVEAIPFYRRAGELSRRSDDSWSTARFKTAELLLDRGEFPEAAKILDIMQRQGVSGTRYQFDRGRLCAARGDWKGSLQVFDACLNSPQCRRRAALQSAPIAARLGDIKLADRLAEYAAKLPPDPPWPDSIADAVRALKASNVSRNSTADQLEAAGKLQEALQVRRQQVERAGDARSYAALGMLLDKLQHFDEAEAALRKATELDPGQAHYHFYLSTVLFDKAEARRAAHQEDAETLALYEQALTAARRAIELRADHGVAWLYAGWALERLSRQDEAVDAFRHAVAWRPELADTQLALGRTLAAQGKIAEARTHLEAAVRVADPQDPRPREALAALAKEPQEAGE
ncbi:MAG TPA: tetratricopeptide repeat protein, partial [Planctomycetaceae bacterium]|nr:tetratricopeptide repeat protein [Planctomycetaceae bacterium]